MAFDGVPNETRKGLPDGTTLFERVLPGPDRMYPDTDSAPIPIDETAIAAARAALPPASVAEQVEQLDAWGVPRDTYDFILRRALFPLVRRLYEAAGMSPRRAGTLVGHDLRRAARTVSIDAKRVLDVVRAAHSRGLADDVLRPLVPAALAEPSSDLDRLLIRIGYRAASPGDIEAEMERLLATVDDAEDPADARDRIVGALRPIALGNVPLRDVASAVAERIEKACR